MTKLNTFRKHLHAHPELSGQEIRTAKTIAEELKKYNPSQLITSLGGHGVAAIFDSETPGKTSLFRAELDALPIQEVNTFAHASTVKGVSHKCGHDGHATILIGLAQKIQQSPPKKGRVILLFQPAEENGQGAQALLNDTAFTRLQPDQIYALHNVPGFNTGTIVCKPNTFTASVCSFSIQLQGKTAHAAEPENGTNPALAISELIQDLKKLNQPDLSAKDFAVLTSIYVRLGSKDYGISAGDGEVHFTLRCWEAKKLAQLQKTITATAEKICKKHQVHHQIEWFAKFMANENTPAAYEAIRKAAKTNDLTFQEKKYPFKWGEDFGLLTQTYPGAMFGLGAGKNTPALHNPDYDFPDALIPIGVQMFYSLLESHHA